MYSLQRTLKRFKLISLTKKTYRIFKATSPRQHIVQRCALQCSWMIFTNIQKVTDYWRTKSSKVKGILPENGRIPLSRPGQHNRRTPGLQSVFFNVLERFDQWRYAICNNWYRDCFGYFAYHVDVNRLPRPFVLFSVSNKMTTKQI